MDEVREAYTAWSEPYIELFGSISAVAAEDLALITRNLSIRPGVVLDAGCGPGHLTAHLRSVGMDAIGVDMVPEFIEHARTAHPDGRYGLGSMFRLPIPDRSVAGIVAWYSLIHVIPAELDRALSELRRVMIAGGMLVAGFFDGNEVLAFEHKVVTAYTWPVDEFSSRLRRAGFVEVERLSRPGNVRDGVRPHAGLAAMAN